MQRQCHGRSYLRHTVFFYIVRRRQRGKLLGIAFFWRYIYRQQWFLRRRVVGNVNVFRFFKLFGRRQLYQWGRSDCHAR